MWSPADDVLYWTVRTPAKGWTVFGVDRTGATILESSFDRRSSLSERSSLSPDGKWIATADDEKLTLFHVAERRLIPAADHAVPMRERALLVGPWTDPQWSRDSRAVTCVLANRLFLVDTDRIEAKPLEAEGEVVDALWMDADRGLFVVTARHEDTPAADALKVLTLHTEFDRGRWRCFGDCRDRDGRPMEGGHLFASLADGATADVSSQGRECFGLWPWALDIFVQRSR
jgi:hypothetical protein